MKNLLLAYGYLEHKERRESFLELAKKVFGIDFHSWLEKGYGTQKYIPYSFLDRNTVVSNVSVNMIDLIIDGIPKRGIQIGTVMTHPDYRNQGQSKKLIRHILETYSNQYDIMYLFANNTVLDFYPKFGFQMVEETQYSLIFTPDQPARTIQKLDGKNDEDLQFIYEFAKSRKPVSAQFGTLNTAELLMFYSLNVFPHDIYYLKEENVIILYNTDEQNQLHIYDIIIQTDMNLRSIINTIANRTTQKVIFHFTVDQTEDLNLETTPHTGSGALFVLLKNNTKLPKQFKHPITSQA